jgi:lipoyl-dependent peroxiredoxin
MSLHTADALWKGNLKDGSGKIKMHKTKFECAYSFPSRFEDGQGCSPEELIAAAHSACYSMALAHGLAEAGFNPEKIHTTAGVTMDKSAGGFEITKIKLSAKASVKDIDAEKFTQIAQETSRECPVSKALSAVKIELEAELISG